MKGAVKTRLDAAVSRAKLPPAAAGGVVGSAMGWGWGLPGRPWKMEIVCIAMHSFNIQVLPLCQALGSAEASGEQALPSSELAFWPEAVEGSRGM